jgi:hypothetical protein
MINSDGSGSRLRGSGSGTNACGEPLGAGVVRRAAGALLIPCGAVARSLALCHAYIYIHMFDRVKTIKKLRKTMPSDSPAWCVCALGLRSRVTFLARLRGMQQAARVVHIGKWMSRRVTVLAAGFPGAFGRLHPCKQRHLRDRSTIRPWCAWLVRATSLRVRGRYLRQTFIETDACDSGDAPFCRLAS